jgi:hypothetical protein
MSSRARRRGSPQKLSPVEANQPKPVSESPFRWSAKIEWLSPLPLIALAVFFLGISWRKWPDPLIDFGRELYLPWRLSHGAILYRDVDDFFGPLSQYANSVLFRLFAPGMMVLATANLCIFAGILAAVYFLFRRAWGAGAALLASAGFISVFGFAQYVGIANYNYVTPYSHESTHGFFLCLLLAFILLRWVETPILLWSALAGLLFGLAAVLKTEFILAAGLMTLAAVIVRWRYREPAPLPAAGIWAGSAVLPTLGFTAYFSAHVPFPQALSFACHAWLNIVSVYHQAATVQTQFLGLDRPWQNLAAQSIATTEAILLIAGVCGIAWLADRAIPSWQRVILALVLAGGVGWVSFAEINWLNVGRCLPGLAFLYLLFCAVSLFREPKSGAFPEVATARLLIALLAAVLISRMLLNGRIFQYGFYQAALAGLLVPAVLVGELPGRFGFGGWGKAVAALGCVALFVPGVVALTGDSLYILQQKTEAVGEGADQFYTFPLNAEPTGELVRLSTAWLSKVPPNQTLVVLPEGEMINYLSRMPSPVAPCCFYSSTNDGSEEKMVNDLSRHPPDWVVIISRDLHEYGIQRYGEAPGKGLLIMRWVARNYDQAAYGGGSPLDTKNPGSVILRRKGLAAPAP